MKNELRFDAAIDHRAADFPAQLAAACPKGIDVYFENVGGQVFEAVLPLLNMFARVPVCGLISQYNAFEEERGGKSMNFLLRNALTRSLTIRGFIVSNFAARYPDFIGDMTKWFGEGKIKHRETVVEGLANAPKAFIGLLRGENFGKQLVRVGPDKL